MCIYIYVCYSTHEWIFCVHVCYMYVLFNHPMEACGKEVGGVPEYESECLV